MSWKGVRKVYLDLYLGRRIKLVASVLVITLVVAGITFSFKWEEVGNTPSPRRGDDDDDVITTIETLPRSPLFSRPPTKRKPSPRDHLCATYKVYEKLIVKDFKTLVLQKRIRTLVDIGSVLGQYAFMAASAGVYVFSFENEGVPLRHSSKIVLNNLFKVPKFVDLLLIHQWEDYEEIIDHCLKESTVQKVYILKQRQQCDWHGLAKYVRGVGTYVCEDTPEILKCELQ
jgi:hypothetical protein